jgi:hypothetical protein
MSTQQDGPATLLGRQPGLVFHDCPNHTAPDRGPQGGRVRA